MYVYMCIYVYVCVYVRKYVYICVYMSILIYAHICVYMCIIHECVYVYMCIYVYTESIRIRALQLYTIALDIELTLPQYLMPSRYHSWMTNSFVDDLILICIVYSRYWAEKSAQCLVYTVAARALE